MNNTSKNIILVVAVGLTILSCFMSVGSSRQAAKIREGLDQERYNRMVAEEELEKSKGTVTSLQTQLDVANLKIKSIQSLVDEGQNVKSNLQAQLQSITQLKASLEKQLQDMQKKSEAMQQKSVEAAAVISPQPAAAGTN